MAQNGKANTDNDSVVEHPTWFGQIRNFFTDDDISHMAAKGIDLATYMGAVANAISIYSQTSAGSMPPGAATKWSANRVQTFLNWITDNYPLGTAPPPTAAMMTLAAASPAARIRKDVTRLSADEIAKLKTAFSGIMARDPAQADSFFAIAGVHWYPAIDQDPTFHCLHHENRFLPWHRLHLKRFEDALRSVPGCADVTLPYWDITTPIPALLYDAPFASYTLQAPIGHGYDPLTTSRYTADEIAENINVMFGIPKQIISSLKKSVWEQFNTTFWGAHDNGHVSCGTTMENQDISAFDPVFFFFHCNLDRIWLEWQRRVGATTVAGFKSTCQSSTAWLDVPALGALPPFDGVAADTIAFPEVDYAPPAQGMPMMKFENKAGNVAAAQHFRIESAAPLSVRVKDIDRSAIPGTFVVHLMADGKEVARQAFFQPTDPRLCPSCSKEKMVAVDFHVDSAKILDKDLSIEMHVPGQRAIGTKFPMSMAGKPTINVRHLVEGE
jgi:hypothetical protein